MNELRSFELLNYYMNKEEDVTAYNETFACEEIENNDCWPIWEVFFASNEILKFDKFSAQNKFTTAIQKFKNMTGSEAFRLYQQKCEKILENKMAEYGVYPIKFEGHNVYGIDIILYDENYKQAYKEAEEEAKEELSFSSKFCEFAFWGRCLEL